MFRHDGTVQPFDAGYKVKDRKAGLRVHFRCIGWQGRALQLDSANIPVQRTNLFDPVQYVVSQVIGFELDTGSAHADGVECC